MFASAVIVFREVLEAALVISIVLAATRGLPGRGRWVRGGVLAGVVAAALMALAADRISQWAEGMGQEIVNATILFVAVGMLAWHNVWMSRHGAELARHMKEVGRAVSAGERPLYAIAIVVGLAVVREGAEVVLFLAGIAAGGSSTADLIGGGALGVIAGSAFGVALYLGLLKIPMRHVFRVSSWLILLLAAGMASQGAGFLVQANLLPSLGDAVWDTSNLLSERSLPGQILHALVGYVSQPSGMQLLFYATTLVIVGALMRFVGRTPVRLGAAAASMAVVAVAVVLVLALGVGHL